MLNHFFESFIEVLLPLHTEIVAILLNKTLLKADNVQCLSVIVVGGMNLNPFLNSHKFTTVT